MRALSTRTVRVRRWVLAAGAGLAVAGAGSAQTAADPLERARAIRAVADQKAEASIREAVAEADKLAAASPATAIQRLKRAGVSLDLSTEIGSVKRKELAALIQNKIAAIENKAAAPAADPKTAKLKDDQRKWFEAYLQEVKDVRQAIADADAAYAANNPRAAQAAIAAISQKYPNNPAVIALAGQGSLGDRATEAKVLAAEQDRRVAAALNQVQESALPAVRDVEFPKNWAEIVKKREAGEPQLGPEELALLQALEKRIGNGTKDTPFLETVQVISNMIGKEIYIDRKSLDDAGMDLQRPVSMPGNVSARTALRAILQGQGLTFVIKDQLIQVVTLERARSLSVTKAYYLGELVAAAGPLPGGAPVWGPVIDYQQTMSNAQVVVDSIMQSIDPLVWQGKGGPATIAFHYASMSIIVRAPSEVHAGFRGKLSPR